MIVYKTERGIVLQEGGRFFDLPNEGIDSLLSRRRLFESLKSKICNLESHREDPFSDGRVPIAPIENQEVWAAGVTYYRSRDARIEESKEAGGGDFYDRVYNAERPEIFFKATPHRVSGYGEKVRIRKDSTWNVPEPELTLVISSSGEIVGYTIGNDMSSRDIEGQNPLYLPQAKTYDKCCALGPGILLADQPLPATTGIHMEILRSGRPVFEGTTDLSQIKRSFETLVRYLFLESSFPRGCFLMTGTGIVPPRSFTLKKEDEIRITINPIGTLIDYVE
jgi:2-dehydro-3-deoxy-D-arabinonate dehydratase